MTSTQQQVDHASLKPAYEQLATKWTRTKTVAQLLPRSHASSRIMRRILGRANGALRRNKHAEEPISPENSQVVFNFSLDAAGLDGYSCWDSAQCGLCSYFLERWFILKMFTSKFVDVGTTVDLLQWSQAGGKCPLCNYIVMAFIKETGGELPLDARFIIRWVMSSKADRSKRDDELMSFDFELGWGYDTGHIRVRKVNLSCFTNDGESVWLISGVTDTNDGADQAMGFFVTTRSPNPDVESSTAFLKAKAWLSECDEGHTRCRKDQLETSDMPTRLLEISTGVDGSMTVRLHETVSEVLPYVALSYMWGGPQSCQTMQDNIETYLQEVDIKTLPTTIVDALRCTEELGLKHLWVDSLCIIQDSPEDKAREIGRMSMIYKNAYVTISAAQAKSCEDGFLHPRKELRNLLQTSFRIEIITPNDPVALRRRLEEYRVNEDRSNLLSVLDMEDDFANSIWNTADVWNSTPSQIWLAATPLGDDDVSDLLTGNDFQDEPINERGWTLQESWLSTRILIYGSSQMTWRCREGFQCDGGLVKRDHRWTSQVSAMDSLEEFSQRGTSSSRQIIMRSLWRDVVTEASRRALSVASDKLNAVEGIVQELRRMTGDEYLAGLWLQRLPSDLSWYQDPTHRGSESLLLTKERTCPSWSWISTDGPVSFSFAENSEVAVEAAEIIRNEITGQHPNSRLRVDGAIQLRAPMSTLPIDQTLPNFMFPGPEQSRLAFTNVIYPDGALTNPYVDVQDLNGQPQIMLPDDLRFLELSWGKQDGQQNTASESRGLVLVPGRSVDGRTDVYERFGFFFVALEEDVDAKSQGLILSLSVEPGNVRMTEFGRIWKESLKEEVVIII